MSKTKPTIVCLSAPPLTGKTATCQHLAELLAERNGRPWVVLDNETNGFSKAARVLCAEASGIKLNSPEFARKFNLRFQLDYQASARAIAGQGDGINVIMPGPFENLTSDVAGLPLFEHMRQRDFADFDFRVVQLLLMPEELTGITTCNIVGHPAMRPIEAEIQRRRSKRGEDDPVQQQLDADKVDSVYYGQRARTVLETWEAFPNDIKKLHAHLGEAPERVAERLATVINEL